MAAIPHSTELATVDGERAEDPLDPLIRPEIYDGVIVRRVVAYLVDLIIIALATLLAMATFAVLGVLSFGVLSPALAVMLPLIPLTYHTAFIGAPASATLGMRLFGLEVRRIEGGRPGYLQAALLTIVFYVTVGVTSWLVLLVALFNGRSRALHDYLCGTLVVRGPKRIEARTL